MTGGEGGNDESRENEEGDTYGQCNDRRRTMQAQKKAEEVKVTKNCFFLLV
jgi:hypothetical protein